MPIYDYACEKCGHRFEARQRFADDPLTMCPECQGPIRRVIHPSGIIFKGSGWYITDSRKSDPAPSGAAAGSSSDSSSPETSSESTPDSGSKEQTESKTAADD
ncbi:zinc ribbon domain-containing protein [soil metagenome]